MKSKKEIRFKLFSSLMIAGFINYFLYFFLYKFTDIDKQSLSLMRTFTGVAVAFYITNRVVSEHYHAKELAEEQEKNKRIKDIKDKSSDSSKS